MDEVDQLLNKEASILYNLFDWPSLQNSRFVLIGIANALDLVQRFLPVLSKGGSMFVRFRGYLFVCFPNSKPCHKNETGDYAENKPANYTINDIIVMAHSSLLLSF